jgi:hypothetical protein
MEEKNVILIELTNVSKDQVNYHRAKDSAASWFIPFSFENKSPGSSPRSAGVE